MVYADAVMGPTTSEPFAAPMDKKRKALSLTLDGSVDTNPRQPPRKRFALLTSPDTNKLTTPTLEKVLRRNVMDTGATPLLTPGTFDLMSTFNRTPTADQTEFVKGFEEKLAELTGQKENDSCFGKLDVSGEETTEVICLNEPIAQHHQMTPDTTYYAIDDHQLANMAAGLSSGSITAIPIYDEADIKSYTDLSYSHAISSSPDTSCCVEIQTVSEPPPNSIPIVATKTASIALSSGGKLLNINFDLDLPEMKNEHFDAYSEVGSESNIPTMLSDFNDDQSTMDSNYDSDDEYKPSLDEKQSRGSRKGNTRPIPKDLPLAEQKKLERKRERNRVAASKCRQRKMQRITELEEQVKKLKNINADLSKKSSKLAKETAGLKAIILEHVKGGCQIVVSHDFMINRSNK